MFELQEREKQGQAKTKMKCGCHTRVCAHFLTRHPSPPCITLPWLADHEEIASVQVTLEV